MIALCHHGRSGFCTDCRKALCPHGRRNTIGSGWCTACRNPNNTKDKIEERYKTAPIGHRVTSIPTEYRGISMKSRLETRIAKELDRQDLTWDYEVEGFDIDGVWYLPDFWIPSLSLFLEGKGLFDESVEKPIGLARALEAKGARIGLVDMNLEVCLLGAENVIATFDLEEDLSWSLRRVRTLEKELQYEEMCEHDAERDRLRSDSFGRRLPHVAERDHICTEVSYHTEVSSAYIPDPLLDDKVDIWTRWCVLWSQIAANRLWRLRQARIISRDYRLPIDPYAWCGGIYNMFCKMWNNVAQELALKDDTTWHVFCRMWMTVGLTEIAKSRPLKLHERLQLMTVV